MVTTIYWMAFLAAVIYLYVLIARERERRARINRLRQLRERRAWRDAQTPQRWQ